MTPSLFPSSVRLVIPKKATAITLVFLGLLLAARLFAVDQALGVPVSTNVRGADYPRVLRDNRGIFQLKTPSAQQVKFDCGTTYPADKNAEGNWTVTTDPRVPGFHYYWLVVDNTWLNNPASEPFYGVGTQCSGIETPEPGEDGAYYSPQVVPHGEVRERW